MKRLRLFLGRVRRAIVRDPVMLSMLVVVVVFGGYTLIELARANAYEDSVDNYRQSATVQNLVSDIDRFSRLTQGGEGALLCDMTALTVFKNSPSETTQIFESVRRNAESAQQNVPSFSSAAVYLPYVRDNRDLSGDLAASLQSIEMLVREDSKGDYCANLAQVLSGASFLDDLSRPEGVSALFVGQVENFWVNLDSVQEEFRAISNVPADFATEHGQVNESLNQFALLLREDTNAIDTFSSKIEEELERLDLVFDDIRDKTTNLQEIPDQLQLQTVLLRP